MGAPAKPIVKLEKKVIKTPVKVAKTVTKVPKKVIKTATKIPKKVIKTATKVPKKIIKTAAKTVAPKPKIVYETKTVEKEVPRPPEPKDVVRVSGGEQAQKDQAGRVRATRGQKYRPVLTGPGGVTDPAKTKKKRLLGA